MKKMNPWWMAAGAAVVLTALAGATVAMGQENPTPGATTTAQSTATADGTPAAQATPGASTPDAAPDTAPRTPDGERRGCGGLKGVDAEALATFLGTTPEALRTELQAEGATLATVAAAHGQSRDALIAFLTSATETRLAEKVTAGDLTQAEADEKLAEFTANIGERIDASPAFGGGFRHREGAPGVVPSGTSFRSGPRA